jgi:hypothetical protein
MMSGVSHAQRPPRQRLRSNGVFGNFDPPQIKLAQKWCWLQWNAGTECNIMLPLVAFPKNY